MKAEIISTGTELLLGKTLNTSAHYLTGQLSDLGIEVLYHTTVGDNKERLTETLKNALQRSGLVLVSGGLGPTVDDLSKEIAAEVFGLKMSYDPESMQSLTQFYINDRMPPSTEKQAYFPEGSILLPNDKGTALGALICKNDQFCAILPGPPSEMEVMFQKYLLPKLEQIMLQDSGRMQVRILKIFGLGEPELERELTILMQRKSPSLTLLDRHTYMDVRLTVRSGDVSQAVRLLDQTEAEIRSRLGDGVFGTGTDTPAGIVGKLLLKNNLTLATAESCTGGLLGGRITAEAGSSAYYLGGVVSYANSAKETLLGVKSSSLLQEGAVSELVAGEMAEGTRKALGADIGIATTGVAGPGGGTADKPVGLVYIALAHPEGIEITKNQFVGSRESVRNMIVETALNMLRLYLLRKCKQ
ncbi:MULTISPECIES: competence/damage-inducible protein A [unclassified Dehalobacter]|jgi:competence/damage-inducible protein CinA C-terminal domain|nr:MULTISPECIES: competence/damage-inducible protein A [unclassified Dehalobacter]AFV01342.1 Molybdopterin binding motif, CinA N-terminal domain / C-terminal domain of CinA type S [Dehalobacter sp. DCA]AFV04382.1 Competence/damage-inducible protein CinA [Dehalobacter sp. CF]